MWERQFKEPSTAVLESGPCNVHISALCDTRNTESVIFMIAISFRTAK